MKSWFTLLFSVLCLLVVTALLLTSCERPSLEPPTRPTPSLTPSNMYRQCVEQPDIIYCQAVCEKKPSMTWCNSEDSL